MLNLVLAHRTIARQQLDTSLASVYMAFYQLRYQSMTMPYNGNMDTTNHRNKMSRCCVYECVLGGGRGQKCKKEKETQVEYKDRSSGRKTISEKDHKGPIKQNNPESHCLHYANVNFKRQLLVGRNNKFYLIYLEWDIEQNIEDA